MTCGVLGGGLGVGSGRTWSDDGLSIVARSSFLGDWELW